MKILHISEYFLDGWKYQENLLPRFQSKLGHEVVVLASTNFPSYLNQKKYIGEKEYFNDGIKIIRYQLKSSFYKSRIYGLNDLIKQESPDLLFIHGFHLLRDKKLVKTIIGERQFKIVMDSHADYFSSGFYSSSMIRRVKSYVIYRFIYTRLIHHIIPYIDKFFCISPASEIFANEKLGIPKENIFSLPLGIDLDDVPYINKSQIKVEIRSKYNLPKNAIIAITAGKQDKEKRSSFLVDTFNKINNSETYLFIVGNINKDIDKELKTLAALNDRIIMTDWVKPEELIKLMLASDFAVFPGSQSVLWQHALGCGLPAIFKYWPGVDYLSKGNAYFLKTDNETELLEYMTLLINSPKLRENLGEIAREHCVENFNYEKIAQLSIQ